MAGMCARAGKRVRSTKMASIAEEIWLQTHKVGTIAASTTTTQPSHRTPSGRLCSTSAPVPPTDRPTVVVVNFISPKEAHVLNYTYIDTYMQPDPTNSCSSSEAPTLTEPSRGLFLALSRGTGHIHTSIYSRIRG